MKGANCLLTLSSVLSHFPSPIDYKDISLGTGESHTPIWNDKSGIAGLRTWKQ